MKKILIVLSLLLMMMTLSLSASRSGYEQINNYQNGDCDVALSIKVVSSDKDDGQIRYKYTKDNCPKSTKVQLVDVQGGYSYKKKRKNIFFRALDNYDNPQFVFRISLKNPDGFTESGLMFIPIDIGEHKECDSVMEALGICNVDTEYPEPECDSVMEALGICTNSAQVDIAVSDMFSVNEKYARIEIIVDKDNTIIDSVQIINMVFEGDVIVRNDDNDIVEFPEEINNNEQWELETTTFGNKKLISYSYKVFFINDGDQEEKQPITVEKQINLDLSSYSD